jgi:hypothetical protein
MQHGKELDQEYPFLFKELFKSDCFDFSINSRFIFFRLLPQKNHPIGWFLVNYQEVVGKAPALETLFRGATE